MLAVINGHYDMAALLLERAPIPTSPSAAGTAALYAAVDMNTLQFMHGRPHPGHPGRLTAADLVKVLLELRRQTEPAAQDAHAAAATTPATRVLAPARRR